MKRLRGRLSCDHAGAALVVLLGLAAAGGAGLDAIGSLSAMGSGFFPRVLGVLLVIVGVAIALTTPLRPADGPPRPARAAEPPVEGVAPPAGPPDLRAWSCILASLVLFVVLAGHGGLVPASFASVLVAALGDRSNRLRDAAGLAAVMTAFGVLVFHVGLHVLLPLFAWS